MWAWRSVLWSCVLTLADVLGYSSVGQQTSLEYAGMLFLPFPYP